MTNVEQLQNAGLIVTRHPLTPQEIESVNQLTQPEVDALISVRTKLGDNFFARKVQDGDSHHMGTLFV